MTNIEQAASILEEVIQLLRRPDTDVIYSRYDSASEAISDLERHVEKLKHRDYAGQSELKTLFAPTGSLQEIAIQSGWGEIFLELAARMDRAL